MSNQTNTAASAAAAMGTPLPTHLEQHPAASMPAMTGNREATVRRLQQYRQCRKDTYLNGAYAVVGAGAATYAVLSAFNASKYSLLFRKVNTLGMSLGL